LEISIKTEKDIEEAVENITEAIKKAIWQETPDGNEQNSKEKLPIIVKQKNSRKKKGP
jgi:predicted RNase H-like HicB family nuclease